jgi:hypothetical protein
MSISESLRNTVRGQSWLISQRLTTLVDIRLNEGRNVAAFAMGMPEPPTSHHSCDCLCRLLDTPHVGLESENLCVRNSPAWAKFKAVLKPTPQSYAPLINTTFPEKF